jgi:hypothetical protein
LRSRVSCGFILLAFLAVQIIAAYYSMQSLLAEEWLKGVIFFLVVPALGYLLAYCYLLFNKGRGGQPPLDRREHRKPS